jgi:hypothetical protein
MERGCGLQIVNGFRLPRLELVELVALEGALGPPILDTSLLDPKVQTLPLEGGDKVGDGPPRFDRKIDVQLRVPQYAHSTSDTPADGSIGLRARPRRL